MRLFTVLCFAGCLSLAALAAPANQDGSSGSSSSHSKSASSAKSTRRSTITRTRSAQGGKARKIKIPKSKGSPKFKKPKSR